MHTSLPLIYSYNIFAGIKEHQHIYERRENEIGDNTPTCRELYTKPRRG
jgi:hypothetical protein